MLDVGDGKEFPTDFRDLLVKKWLLSAVAAALKPYGFRCRGVLTLQGPQGLGKTSWGRNLVPDQALGAEVVRLDHHLDSNNKDSVLIAISHWIVEIGELESSFKRDVARLKGFLTQDIDKVRRPYAKEATEYRRRTVFFATVNSYDFLIDSTGNARFWTLPLVDVKHDHDIDMQQVFAQLAVELNGG
ncbi:VapE domain-containing protein [Novosphingobium sp. PhB55]|uniref:VapE domain-containing protein n=1 Tax=Novosphingobium sp. PhB55 TaxID=2485106 RepID=UPI001416F487|nr:VapE domain-containing protein [Novosphingobium sp. PhB55]